MMWYLDYLLLKWIIFPCRLDAMKLLHIFKKGNNAREASISGAGVVVLHQGVSGSGIQKDALDAQS